MTTGRHRGQLPLVAILRGITPQRIQAVADVLVTEGIGVLEVPLNSPQAFQSIEILAKKYAALLTGAGTVLDPADVDRLADMGAGLVVTPNTNPAVIARAVARQLTVMPGFYTASEAFCAIAAGARLLKLFPAATAGCGHLKALRAVLPKDVPVYAVGGIGPATMAQWLKAGAAGFGLGSELFRPELSDQEIALRARQSVAAFKDAGPYQLV